MTVLPTGLVAGASGHVSYHNEIHRILTHISDTTFVGAGMLQGTFAARPAAGVAHRLYYATDSGVLYYDTGAAWVDIATAATLSAHIASAAPHSGEIPKSLIDAKGDLIVGAADNTPARLPPGTDGYVLTADSGETGGVKWAAPSPGIFHGARAYRSSSFVLPSGSSDIITWTSEDYDTDGIFAPSSQNFVVPFDGYFSGILQVEFDFNATGYREIGIQKNGANIAQPAIPTVTSNSHNTVMNAGTGAFQAITGDIIRTYARQTSGGNLNVIGGAQSTFFVLEFRGL